MKIAFYKADKGNFEDKFIGWITKSPYSHCELIFSDGISASSSVRDAGIRFKYITYGDKWDIFQYTGNRIETEAKQYFIDHDEDYYDRLGALGSAFNKDWSRSGKQYCSYACANALGLNPVVSPGDFYKELLKNKLIIPDTK